MSARGVRLAAAVFQHMQQARHDLIAEAMNQGVNTQAGQQDLLLARIFDIANDTSKEKFMEAVSSFDYDSDQNTVRKPKPGKG